MKMRLKYKTEDDGKTVLVCENSYLFGLIKREVMFTAMKEYPKGYWQWLKMPDYTLVHDSLSFQLDAWNKV